jgi:hypothetical protein
VTACWAPFATTRAIAIVRAEVVVTVEKGDRFWQLVTAAAAIHPRPNEGLTVGDLGVQVRTGTV